MEKGSRSQSDGINTWMTDNNNIGFNNSKAIFIGNYFGHANR